MYLQYILTTFLASNLLALAAGNVGDALLPISDTNVDAYVQFAGNVEGKTFWAVIEPNCVNWTTAGSKCEERNMKYAEITTHAQAQVILAAYASPGLTCCGYWTSGRDALETRQFSWNASKTDVSNSDLRLHEVFNDVKFARSCVMFFVNDGFLHSYACNSCVTRGYLCEENTG